MGLTKSQLEQRRAAGRSRAKAFTPEHQRSAGLARAKTLTFEHQSAAGKLGYLATVSRHGKGFALDRINQGMPRPSGLESLVIGWLEDLALPFKRGVKVETDDRLWYIDFVVCDTLAIEVDGEYWHSQRLDRDRQKLADLKSLGYRVWRFSERAITTTSARSRLRRFAKEKTNHE